MQQLVTRLTAEISKVLLGKEPQIKLALACLFARGHLLIEDMPGMGKTTLAHALAAVFGLSYQRIQFTSDLLPADILGVSVFDRNSSQFEFHPGPIFSQVLLADEINRTTPKTQSALLEAMEEGQVTVEGETRQLPQPFFVIATQNPLSSSGTFPLPESQLDRFLMRIELGYPSPEAERALLLGDGSRSRLPQLKACITKDQLSIISMHVEQVKISAAVLDYLQRLIAYTRDCADFSMGISPRGALALLRTAKTWAVMHGRKHLLPEDIQSVLPAVVAHRVSKATGNGDQSGYALIDQLLNEVDVIS
jgi:MoxR-like ATPase|tara:strand:+ start:281 stop:1201 length:921 start_codon:yes stop_codon:yes gene_type:complete